METTDVGVTGATGGITVVTTCLASKVTTTMGMRAAHKKLGFIRVHPTELRGNRTTRKILKIKHGCLLVRNSRDSLHVGGSYVRLRFEQQ